MVRVMDATQSPPAVPQKIVSTQEGYDQWSVIYDGEDNPLIALEERCFGALLGEVHGREVVDVGCGTGRHTLPLARAGARVTALDFSSGMLAAAQRKAEGLPVRFLCHDLAQPLPLPDAAYDLVLSCLVIEHIADLQHYFRELARVCRPDGAVVLSAMHPAMMLLGVSARFTSPDTGEKIYPQSHKQQISDYVLAAARAGLLFEHMSEHVVDEALIKSMPRAERYKDWPMLLLMRLRKAASAG